MSGTSHSDLYILPPIWKVHEPTYFFPAGRLSICEPRLRGRRELNMSLLADVHRHLEGEGHLPLLGGGRAVGAVALQVGDIHKSNSRNLCFIILIPFISLQPGAARGHPHPGAPALLPHHHHHHPAQLLHDDHALQRADRVIRVSIIFVIHLH